MKKSNVFGTFS